MTRHRPLLAGLLLLTAGQFPAMAADAPRGAAGCLGCHAAKPGIDGAAVRLNGRNPNDLVLAMQAYVLGQKPSTVMGRIAKGFSDVETRAIADWLSEQP